MGSYIHPPDTRDITSQVTWRSDIPQLVQVNGGVVSPTGAGCGVANISASMKDEENLITGHATVTVNDPTNSLCPGGSSAQGFVSVTIPTGGGSVTSVPAGIKRPGTCSAQFNVGQTVLLIPAPASGHSFVGWNNCPSVVGDDCSIDVDTTTVAVQANFN